MALVVLYEYMAFWQISSLSFLCSVPNLVYSEVLKKSKDEQKRISYWEKDMHTQGAVARAFRRLVYRF